MTPRDYTDILELPPGLTDGQRLPKPSMNEANERDPFNNNCYGTLVDRGYKLVSLPVLDVIDFNERIIRGYEEGWGEKDLPADLTAGPLAGPGRHRHAARLQQHLAGNPRVHHRELHRLHGLRDRVPRHRHPRQGAVRDRAGGEAQDHSRGRPRRCIAAQWSKTKKYYDAGKKKRAPAACSRSSSTRRKCKGCAECVTVCDDNALKMIAKTDEVMTDGRARATATSRTSARPTTSTSTTACSST